MVLSKLLQPGSAVRAAADHEKLGCCTLVAIIVMALSGHVPQEPSRWQNWYKLDRDWWQQANNWHAKGCWATILAALERLGPAQLQLDWSGQELALTPGRWHIIQEWTADYSSGHTYLIYVTDTGQIRKVDSNERRGYRNILYPHWSRFGKLAAVVTLSRLD